MTSTDKGFTELARSQIAALYPGASQIKVQVLVQDQDRAVVVAEPVFKSTTTSPIQILLLELDNQWIVWNCGQYEGWLEVEGGMGVAIKSYVVDPATKSVRFTNQVSEAINVGNHRRAHAALWSVSSSEDWIWPTVEEIYVEGATKGGLRPAAPWLGVTPGYLVGEYIAEVTLDSCGWAWNVFADLIGEHPRLALDLIILAVNACDDAVALTRIGAGHLETLVNEYGELLDKTLSKAALSDPKLRLALQSLWVSLPSATASVVSEGARPRGARHS